MEVELQPFQAFMDTHRNDVYRFLVSCVGHEEADDCFQETFLSALRAYPRLEDSSNLRGWVLTIAYRKAIDAHRSRKRRPPLRVQWRKLVAVPSCIGAGCFWSRGSCRLTSVTSRSATS